MIRISSPQALDAEIKKIKSTGKSIGFVPTMGALHAGHIALVKRAVTENDYTVVSIFVNPTQFNNAEDLEKYPRKLDTDSAMLQEVACDIIFAPAAQDIYKTAEIAQTFEFDFGGLDKVMEGKFRPGHFNGVVQIVSKLFNYVQPTRAYFGEKDFQQLAIVHRMTELMEFDTKIVDCSIVREPSGLAMSSRNERLSSSQRETANNISRILFDSQKLKETMSPQELAAWVVEHIQSVPNLKLEYFEIADTKSLQTASNWLEPTVGCIAVFCGNVRLIDNVRYN
ncbi:MAG: pantoate--beta-alanine ligase [Porphyromonadaceae bacterium CG2_30_38_12]|nr:MAG: pantoate--beta-alanine ligase [Porphyromonadaceae bacterium CG2_30_38_12]